MAPLEHTWTSSTLTDECADKLLTDSNGRNYGWTVRDSFVERLKAGDQDAMRRFTKALHIKLDNWQGLRVLRGQS